MKMMKFNGGLMSVFFFMLNTYLYAYNLYYLTAQITGYTFIEIRN